MNWVLVSRGFWRTPCGRFDKMYVGGSHPYYSVFDWDYGKSDRFKTVEEADNWARDRAEKYEPALTAGPVGG